MLKLTTTLNAPSQDLAPITLVIAVAIAPLAFGGYELFQLSMVMIYAIALTGLNLLTGYNGQLSLGHGAFFALGAYGTAIAISRFGLPY